MYQPSRARRARLLAVVLVFASLCFAPRFASPAAADGSGDATFDGPGAAPGGGDRSTGTEFIIENFSSDGQVVRWPANASPVPFCTLDANRPATVTATQFRDAVRLAVEMWNSIDAAIGVRYIGDCATSVVTTGDLVNEIGWDDARNVVTGSQAGLTRGSWLTSPGSAIGYFDETDIFLDNNLNIPEVCLRTLLAHEMGHAIGFGHSDTRGDLMWPSYDRNDITTCRPSASAAEVAWLINLYGSNLKPVLTKPADRSVQAGAPVSLTAEAIDPEGDAITFEWKQTGGPAIALASSGATTLFTAPESGPVTIEVSVLDRFRHRATGTVTVTVTPAGGPVGGGFRSALAPSGVTLAQWGGGNITLAVATSGVRVRSLWVFRGGVAIGYIAGAPDFVNQPFLALFPGGTIPEGTLLVAVTGN